MRDKRKSADKTVHKWKSELTAVKDTAVQRVMHLYH